MATWCTEYTPVMVTLIPLLVNWLAAWRPIFVTGILTCMKEIHCISIQFQSIETISSIILVLFQFETGIERVGKYTAPRTYHNGTRTDLGQFRPCTDHLFHCLTPCLYLYLLGSLAKSPRKHIQDMMKTAMALALQYKNWSRVLQYIYESFWSSFCIEQDVSYNSTPSSWTYNNTYSSYRMTS